MPQREQRPQPNLYLVHPRAPAGRRDAVKVRHDPYVHRAIELMRVEPSKRWTVTTLARSVALSRAAFARRFVQSAGVSPLRYLTRLRMERAAELLRGSDEGLAHVAVQVGYQSEFAFNRAFKRHYEVAPGTFRRQVQFGQNLVIRAAA